MKRENIREDISGATVKLLNLARQSSFNYISDNCSFIISEIKESEKNVFEQAKIRKADNDKKMPKSLDDITIDLEQLYPSLYDVNLYVYKANKDSTIVEIQYFPRSSHDTEYQKISATQETMLHCKIAIPSYASTTKEKFDINWEHGPLNHLWKMFWWRQRIKKYIKEHARPH
jgi:hypothetical protein